jgi:hypothetical protein
MTLQTEGNTEVNFKPRPVAGAEGLDHVAPRFLLLDGQQRITSLYQALWLDKPVRTTDNRKKSIQLWYYADIEMVLGEGAREEAMLALPPYRVLRYKREVVHDCSTQEKEIEAGLFPLSILMNRSKCKDWERAYIRSGEERDEREDRWDEFDRRLIRSIDGYQVPVIELNRKMEKTAVCLVFEKVNTGGMTLTVFELLTAIFAADGFELRPAWEEHQQRLHAHDVLTGIDEVEFLQLVTLLASFGRRREAEKNATSGDRLPGVSCKRADLLKLPLAEFRKWAPIAEAGLLAAVPFLLTENLYRAWDVPYTTQLVPLGALLAVFGRKADRAEVRDRLRRWYWSGVFGELYSSSVETRFAIDLQEVVAWADGGPVPRTVEDATFQASRLLSLTRRNSAAYKGLYALEMRGGLDFRTGDRIDANIYGGSEIDIHHIFPKRWCDANAIPANHRDCIVNKTAIAASTNRSIGGKAPSAYLAQLEGEGMDPARLDSVLRSHLIEPTDLRGDDFAHFFYTRFEKLLGLVEEAMGKPAGRTADRLDNPYADYVSDVEARALEIRDGGESDRTEFKQTARWNALSNPPQVMPALEDMILKSIAAFLNAQGGDLLIGVADDGTATGVAADYATFRKKDRDGFQLWLRTLLEIGLDKHVSDYLRVEFPHVDGTEVCWVQVRQADSPIFATLQSKKGPPLLYVRDQTSSIALEGQALIDYQRRRWN